MNNPGQYPAGWRRSVANEKRINEIVHRYLRDEMTTSDTFEFWGEVVGGVCFCVAIVVLICIGAVLS